MGIAFLGAENLAREERMENFSDSGRGIVCMSSSIV